MRRPLTALVLLLVAPLLFAQVYKWTDPKGVVHYSETPPPTGTKYNQVSVNGGVEPLAQSSSAAGAASASSASAGDTRSADTSGNCAALKSNLATLQGSAPVVMTLGSEKKLLNDEQRKQQTASAQAQYDLYCGSK